MKGIGEEPQELRNAHLLIDTGNFRKVACHLAHSTGLVTNIQPGNTNLSCIGAHQGRKDLDQRRFSRPVWSHQPDQISPLRHEAEPV